MVNANGEISAVGRRKCSVARVRVTPGTGKVVVNGASMNDYFKVDSVIGFINQPLQVTNSVGKFDIVANIVGGGVVGQAGALRHGIARALEKGDETLRSALKSAGMLTRDARVKERKKPGQPGARKRFQFSKR
ncbi:MAG: 30S ribosomal protein S9 [Victivallales bacterium]|nr:30S ribosomal protein S9 [Victivallales bacterium]